MAKKMRSPLQLIAVAALPLAVLAASTSPGLAAAHTTTSAVSSPLAVAAATSSPSASWTNNGARVDVFRVGTDGNLYQKYWTTPAGWSSWTAFAAPTAGLSSAPSATWADNGTRLDIFATGATNGHFYQKYWTSPAGWSSWVDLG